MCMICVYKTNWNRRSIVDRLTRTVQCSRHLQQATVNRKTIDRATTSCVTAVDGVDCSRWRLVDCRRGSKTGPWMTDVDATPVECCCCSCCCRYDDVDDVRTLACTLALLTVIDHSLTSSAGVHVRGIPKSNLLFECSTHSLRLSLTPAQITEGRGDLSVAM